MKSSIVSYPNRGNYGRADWRGNCSGRLIKEMLEYHRPEVFVDPACGGQTSDDVVAELRRNGWKLEYFGLDLHSGFNLIKDSLSARIGGERADYVFFHPPYDSIIQYSGSVWGDAPHPDDLSRCAGGYEEFLMKIRVAMQNIYDCLKGNGNYSILIGDVRQNGQYRSIQADLLQIAPGALDGIIIKAQHNCVSDSRNYSGKNFIKIQHEYLLNFRKDRLVFGMLDTTLAVSRRLEALSRANWSATIRTALMQLGGEARLPEIYEVIETTSPETVKPRKNWRERVRAELQTKKHFRNVERGVWALAC